MPCGDGNGWPYDPASRRIKLNKLPEREETPEERRARYAENRRYAKATNGAAKRGEKEDGTR